MIAEKDFRVARFAPRVSSDDPNEACFHDLDLDNVLAGNPDDLCGHCSTPALGLNHVGEIVRFIHDAHCPSDEAESFRRAARQAIADEEAEAQRRREAHETRIAVIRHRAAERLVAA